MVCYFEEGGVLGWCDTLKWVVFWDGVILWSGWCSGMAWYFEEGGVRGWCGTLKRLMFRDGVVL